MIYALLASGVVALVALFVRARPGEPKAVTEERLAKIEEQVARLGKARPLSLPATETTPDERPAKLELQVERMGKVREPAIPPTLLLRIEELEKRMDSLCERLDESARRSRARKPLLDAVAKALAESAAALRSDQSNSPGDDST